MQRSRAEMEANLRSPGPAGAHRSGAGDSDPRSRRAGSAEVNSGLRIGDGVEIKDGRFKVPLGEGLEIDRRGQVSSTGLRGLAIIKTAYGSNLDDSVYVPLPISDPLSSYNPRGIRIDTTTDTIELDTGGVYVIEAALTFLWDQNNSNDGPAGLMKVELTLAGGSAVDVYPQVSLKLEGSGEATQPSTAGVITSVVNLLGSPVSGSVRVMVGATEHDGGSITVRHANIKIERIG